MVEMGEDDSVDDHWSPVEGRLITRWAADVDPAAPWPEYPRPQLRRAAWQNLNGLWDYAITGRDGEPEGWDGRILVPFPVESSLSGVGRPLQPDQRLWVRRRFGMDTDWLGTLVRLHFGAVDWEATVWCNGRELGSHRGGFLPFSFDLDPDALLSAGNELIVAVWDPTETEGHQVGKQRLHPKRIQYTPVSGIWQTVWMEPLPAAHIDRLRVTPDADLRSVVICPEGVGAPRVEVDLIARDGVDVVARARTTLGSPVRLAIPDARPWSPDDPHLYDLDVRIVDPGRPGGDSDQDDSLTSYFGLRWFDTRPDGDGCPRLHLNGEPVFQLGPLDQGYWPDGLYTAPTDKALEFDVEVGKRLGFNMVRKHVKVEPLRWYYHCDRLGLIVWQDMPNGGGDLIAPVFMATQVAFAAGAAIRDDRLLGRFGRRRRSDRDDFRRELRELIVHLRDITCIGGWVPFNEGWGQFDSVQTAAGVKRLDPTRPVDAASGWFDQGRRLTCDPSTGTSVRSCPTPSPPGRSGCLSSAASAFGSTGTTGARRADRRTGTPRRPSSSRRCTSSGSVAFAS